MGIRRYLAEVWSATDFSNPALAGYAEEQMRIDTRHGVQTMAGLALLMLPFVAIAFLFRGYGPSYLNTMIIFAALSLHILASAAVVKDIRTLHVLGMAFLVISALAITFLAHRTGDLNIGTMAAIVMLFVAIPLVPWALREALTVIALTCLLLFASLISVPDRFESGAIWTLQLLVFGAAVIVAFITGRNTFVRKQDLRARFELENARSELRLLSMKDHLTGAWNRRFLEDRFPTVAGDCLAKKRSLHVAVLDVDDFKGLNDRFGHQVGDQILIGIADIFSRQIGDSGFLIRLGGDEFLILYWDDDLDELIPQSVDRLQKSNIARSVAGNGAITLSAGIVCSTPDALADLASMYKAADRALYACKNDRRSNPSAMDMMARTGRWKI